MMINFPGLCFHFPVITFFLLNLAVFEAQASCKNTMESYDDEKRHRASIGSPYGETLGAQKYKDKPPTPKSTWITRLESCLTHEKDSDTRNEVYQLLGEIEKSSGKDHYRKAIDYHRKAAEVGGKDSRYKAGTEIYSLLQRLDDYHGVLNQTSHLLKNFMQASGDSTLLFWRGDAFEKLGRKSEALDAYTQAARVALLQEDYAFGATGRGLSIIRERRSSPDCGIVTRIFGETITDDDFALINNCLSAKFVTNADHARALRYRGLYHMSKEDFIAALNDFESMSNVKADPPLFPHVDVQKLRYQGADENNSIVHKIIVLKAHTGRVEGMDKFINEVAGDYLDYLEFMKRPGSGSDRNDAIDVLKSENPEDLSRSRFVYPAIQALKQFKHHAVLIRLLNQEIGRDEISVENRYVLTFELGNAQAYNGDLHAGRATLNNLLAQMGQNVTELSVLTHARLTSMAYEMENFDATLVHADAFFSAVGESWHKRPDAAQFVPIASQRAMAAARTGNRSLSLDMINKIEKVFDQNGQPCPFCDEVRQALAEI